VAKCAWIVGTFAAMYLVATLVGFAAYLLISPVAMWIYVFTLMPVVSALLMSWYLVKMRISRQASLIETVYLALAWIGLSFGLDAATYIFIIPAVSHSAPSWTFFRDQSPWIWLSYAVLIVCAYAGHRLHLRRLHA